MNQIEKNTLKLLRKIAKDVAKRYKFKYTGVLALHRTHYLYETCHGVCDENDKIRIRLRNLSEQMYPLHSLVRTLAHELAHVGQPDEEPVHGHKWKWRYIKYKKYIETKWGDIGI